MQVLLSTRTINSSRWGLLVADYGPQGMTVLPESSSRGLSIPVTPAAFGAPIAQELGDLGDTLKNHVIQMQELDNKAKSDAAWQDKLTNDIGPLYSNYQQTQGSAAYTGYKDFADQLEAQRKAGAEGLNPAQASLYNEYSRRMTGYMLENASNHAASERSQFINDTHTTKVKGFSDASAAAWNNSDQFDDIQKQTAQEMHEFGAHMGEPEVATQQKIFAAQSANWKQRLETMALQNQPKQAEQLFQQNIDKFTAPDQLAVGRALHSYSEAMNIQNGVTSIVGGHFTIPKDMDALTHAMVSEESGFKPGIAGPMTKYGQAHGLLQMMDGTGQAIAIKLGLLWRPDLMRGTTPEAAQYQLKLGQAHFADLMQQYGNPAVALAAYNAGSGNKDDPRVDAWLAQNGNPAQGQISTQAWIDQIPFSETKKYVQDILAKAGGIQEGSPPTNEDINAELPRMLEQARNATDDPVYNAKLESAVKSYAGTVSSAQTAARNTANQAITSAMTGGQLGTDPKPTSIDQLLAMPGIKEQWAQMNATARKQVFADLARNATGPRAPTPEMIQNYHTIQGMAFNDPLRFSHLDIMSEPTLTLSQKNSLLSLQNKQEKENPHLINALRLAQNIPGVPQRTDPRNREAGPTQEWNNFTGRLTDELSNFIDTRKLEPNDKDVADMVTKIVQQKPDGSGWFGGGTSPEYMQHPHLPLKKSANIPEGEAVDITNQFYKTMGRRPSEYEIGQIYSRHQARAK